MDVCLPLRGVLSQQQKGTDVAAEVTMESRPGQGSHPRVTQLWPGHLMARLPTTGSNACPCHLQVIYQGDCVKWNVELCWGTESSTGTHVHVKPRPDADGLPICEKMLV